MSLNKYSTHICSSLPTPALGREAAANKPDTVYPHETCCLQQKPAVDQMHTDVFSAAQKGRQGAPGAKEPGNVP